MPQSSNSQKQEDYDEYDYESDEEILCEEKVVLTPNSISGHILVVRDYEAPLSSHISEQGTEEIDLISDIKIDNIKFED